uniref:Uncharacterized protein n=1 Tax=Trypanosoma congolense (strain IL3000) TaxID=1068625 RepID=G0UU60_TRYCI|nr:conserved hypothetical protein [Trypanosoma congolense IL3000]
MGEVDTERILEELCRAKQNLSEVIDECVFLESQCEQTEGRLKAELLDRDRRIAEISAALMEMMMYTSLMERRVIAPAFGALGSVINRMPAVNVRRTAAIRRVVEALQPCQEPCRFNPPKMTKFQRTVPPSGAASSDGLKDALMPTIEEASALLNGLLKEKVDLAARISRVAFHISNAEGSEHSTTNQGAPAADVDDLHQDILKAAQAFHAHGNEQLEKNEREEAKGDNYHEEELKRLRDIIRDHENTIRQLRLVVSSRSANDEIPTRLEKGDPDVGLTNKKTVAQYSFDDKAIVQDLTKKLSEAEARLIALEECSTKEREALQGELKQARNRSMEERNEYNSVVERLTADLEYLVEENAVLRGSAKKRKYAKAA